jgi:iron-sulfur cluster assembly enzyme ISCU, mitochondrial
MLTASALIDHYTRPRNAGSLDRKDPSVGSGLVGAPACGDVIRLDIQVDEASGTIVDARFKTFGCGSAIASSSYLTTLVKGKRCEFRPISGLMGERVLMIG